MTDAILSIGARPRREGGLAFPRAASLGVTALAGSVLLGWWLEHPGLRSGIAGEVAMNPVTAIAFVLASTALWLQHPGSVSRQSRLLALACAASVVLLALLCASRLYSAWDLGPDRLLFSEQLSRVGGKTPNRMAPNTALNFLLVGVALLVLDYRTRRGWRPAEGLALLTGVFGLVAVAGYVYDSSVLYGIGPFIPMAANTAVGFLVLSAGVLCARTEDGLPALFVGRTAGAVLTRRLLPAALIIPLLLGWLRLEGQKLGLYDQAGGVAFMVTATTLILAALVWRCAVEIDGSERARSAAERRLRDLNEHLEARVAERTEDLECLNEELRMEVDERDRAEGALRRATDELRALFEASPLAICSLTSDGNVRSWNRAAEQLFGWTADEVIGRPLPNVPADRLDEHRELRDRVLGGNPFTNYETKRVCRDGRELDVSISTAALQEAGGAARGLVAAYLDISGRNALEAQLRQAQKMEAVGRLAGGVAHDFNNMLTVIRSAAEFLLDDLDADAPSRKDAVEILDTADRAASLTRQLLAFSRQQVLQLRVVDLNAAVAELEPMVRRVVEENITVRTHLAPVLDRVQVDRSQLDQVILNLVVNARDAMPAGGTLLIETANVVLDGAYPRSHLSTQPGPHVALTVTDSGCGMDAETQARIFEPFFTTKAVGHGTGLGLATVYGIVKQIGGHIWVYSEVGRGTSFKIYFPRYTGADDEMAASPARAAERQDRAGAGILVVEDDLAVRAAVRRVLERYGYRVLEASNGEQALAVMADSSPEIDLVLSDMVMPEMSGLDLRERLRAIRPALPVLLMSGYSEEAITRLGRQGPSGPLIQKPFTVNGLLDKVRLTLSEEATDD